MGRISFHETWGQLLMEASRNSPCRFVVDTMLGRLAKWLRLLGFDTLYQQHYAATTLHSFIYDGRCLVTRSRKRLEEFSEAVCLNSESVGHQLGELQDKGLFSPPPEPFSRCIRCNMVLVETDPLAAKGEVPDYVIHTTATKMKQCPSCNRYYWPGTHRARMEAQLHHWGIKFTPP